MVGAVVELCGGPPPLAAQPASESVAFNAARCAHLTAAVYSLPETELAELSVLSRITARAGSNPLSSARRSRTAEVHSSRWICCAPMPPWPGHWPINTAYSLGKVTFERPISVGVRSFRLTAEGIPLSRPVARSQLCQALARSGSRIGRTPSNWLQQPDGPFSKTGGPSLDR